MESQLKKAEKSKEKLEIIYLAADGRISQRVIRVLDCRVATVLAFCYLKREVRSFHKENILSVYPYRRAEGIS
ncbi:hypothetical protein [Halobacillus sp. Marseille-P3879]|uniref:hypothetical protein n=1 Tax=Halobacillus sp. Marseille-P3879 TaxID=2045014 RepID=UPI000C7E45C0|nr:hypothetical protein [Halobacillus sp. Marseille-P3879]